MRLPPIEPSADERQHAIEVRRLFLAYCEQGFDVDQALSLVETMLHAHISRGGTR